MKGVKEWRQRERAIMERLGFRAQPGSGGLVFTRREDGENAWGIAQLKSTEGKALRVEWVALEGVMRQAAIAHKQPVLVLDFVGREVWVALREQDYLDYLAWREQVWHNTVEMEKEGD